MLSRSRNSGALGILGLSCLLAAGSGCSLHREIAAGNYRLEGVFTREEPLVVLRDSTDGYKRAKALARLEEPLENGGNREEQELYLKILTQTAKEDREPLCRMAAVRTLGTYKDPRAARTLEEVYQLRLPFTPDMNSVLRQQALAGLEQTGDPEARHLLIRVARQPGSPTESSLADRQQTLDERLTAVRGLGRYNQYDAIDALVHVLENEKDAALKDRAHQSLRQATGRELPPEPRLWRQLLNDPNSPELAAQEPNLIQRVVGLK